MAVNHNFEAFKSELIGMVAAKYNIQLGVDDPIFTVVAINDVVLGIYMKSFQEITSAGMVEIRRRIEEIASNYEDDCETIAENLVLKVKDSIQESYWEAAKKAHDTFLAHIDKAGNELVEKLSGLETASYNTAKASRLAMFISMAFGVISLVSLGIMFARL